MTITTPIRLEFAASVLGGKVDREKGIIHDVSIITSGVTARGHNLEVDETTLLQMKELAVKKGKVKTKWNHRSGADAVNGHLFNFRIEGKKLLADWKLLKKHPQYEQVLELAEEQPDTVGLSASFMGDNESKAGKEFARCTELLSVDLVDSAAANPTGLFETVDTTKPGMAKTIPAPGDAPTNDKPVTLEALMGAITGMRGEITDLAGRVTQFESRLEEQEEEEEEEEEEHAEGDDPSEFGSLGDVVRYFEGKIEKAKDEQERIEFQAAYEILEEKVGQLVEFNEQLVEENKIMALALQELQAKTKSKVELSVGGEGKPPSFTIVQGGGRQLTEFEARVEELKKEGKSPADALVFAQGEDMDRYTKHLEAKGAFGTKTLG